MDYVSNTRLLGSIHTVVSTFLHDEGRTVIKREMEPGSWQGGLKLRWLRKMPRICYYSYEEKDKGVVEGTLGKMPSLYGSGTQLGPE